MSDEELIYHLIDYRIDYNTYGDLISGNMRMIEFSVVQIKIIAMASKNNNSGIVSEFANTYKKRNKHF